MKHYLLLFLTIGLLCFSNSQAATIDHAYDSSKNAAQNGTALQTAISGASSGTTIRVQAGTYQGNFTMKDGVNISGGWNSDFTLQTKYGTILDANANGRVVTHPMSGGSANNSVFSTLTIWSNLTIQNGKLTTDEKGAGVLLYGNSRVTDCLIQNNINASSIGGGLAQDCDNRHEDIVAENCVIRNNKAAEGGGVFTQSTISNCIIESDTATTSTGGKGGGGVYLSWGRLKNCIVRNNYAAQDAGGVRAYGNCKLYNCLIADNTCGVKTAGIALEHTLDEVINCTVVNNNQTKTDTDKEYCGIRFDANDASSNKFVNNVIWGNKAGGTVQSQQISSNFTKYSTRTHNAIAGTIPGGAPSNTVSLDADNNNDAGPNFTDPANNDYSLQDDSPLKEAGNNDYKQCDYDCGGGPRQNGDNVDIGAFECQWIDGDRTVPVGQNLQYIINNTNSGNTVKVQAGTFYGNFKMKDGVQVSGGWNAEFTSQTDYATILDAMGSGRVVTQPNEYFEKLTVWDNLTIQNGKLKSNGKGAGVLLYGNSLAQDYDDHAGDIIADNCVIRNNKATHGGGIWIKSTITNSVIEDNKTLLSHPGGGAHLQWGRMYNCIIRRNRSSEDAGGVRAYGNCKLINCLIADNICDVKVAGLALERTLSEVINCTVVNNNQTLSSTDKEYCGIRFDSDNADGNMFVNNVVWGNKAGDVVQDQQVSYSICKYSNATNNAIQGNVPGDFSYTRITLADDNEADGGPYFMNPSEGNYSLGETAHHSPLRNAGIANASVGNYDLNGLKRTVDGTLDIGAYECQIVDKDRVVRAGEDLQDTINHTFSGNAVKVQAGTFTGNFTMKDGVNVSGGWNSDFTSQTDYATILDANNSGRVLNQPSNFSTMTVWSNFTIQHGKLTSNLDTYGAGVFLRQKGQVKHCIIQDNSYTYPSGGEGNNCIGGGVANNEVANASDILVNECIIRRNRATHGGGVRITGTMQNSVIESNTSSGPCGGVQLFNGGRMYNCIVRNNEAGEDAGGVRMNGGAGSMANCLITGNTALGMVGGLSLETAAHTVYNNTIISNDQRSSSDINRCGVYMSHSDGQFCNNIVWGNSYNSSVQEDQIFISSTYSGQASKFLNNALVWSGNLSDGKAFDAPTTVSLDKDTDPGFADAANDDYMPVKASSLYNGGTNSKKQGTVDLAGYARVIDGTVDIGAYEYDRDYFNGNNGVSTDWNTASNWTRNVVPGIKHDAVILQPAAVPANATVRINSIRIATSGTYTPAGSDAITAAGSLDIPAKAALVVNENIQNCVMAENVPASATSTTETTLHIGSASTGNGTLVWGTTGTPGGATVDFYTRSHGASGDDHSVNQYIGTPFSNNPAMLYQYHNSWMYRITYTDGVPDWTRLNGEDGLNEFEGYNLITAYPAGTVYQMDGTLVSNADVTLNGSSTPALVYNGATRANNENVLANSWAAPIKIKNFVAGNFTNVEATIYIFNAGSPADGTGGSGDTPGNYSSYSIGTATESDVIPSMQSFSVYTTAANPVLFLDYSELVQKDAAYGLIIPNKAPKHLSETEEKRMGCT